MLLKDNLTKGTEYIPVEADKHTIHNHLADTSGEEWLYTDKKVLEINKHHRLVVTFNRTEEFKWYPRNSRY